jgi:DNA-binding transcriptional MerR regulator
MEKRYTVAQTCDMVGVKSYVLRYWEEELALRINRNELGHRYYTGYDIQLFLNIKELKSRGLQLRAIKDLVPKISQSVPGETGNKVRLLEENDSQPEKQITEEEEIDLFPPDLTNEEKIMEFQQILERLISQELHMKKEGEDKCRSLDAAIRRQQLARREAAVAKEKKTHRGIIGR